MHVTFSSRERTLREMASLVRKAGWEVRNVRRSEGTVFGYVTAEPIELLEPDEGADLGDKGCAARDGKAARRSGTSESGNGAIASAQSAQAEDPPLDTLLSLPPLAQQGSVTAPLLLPSPLILLKGPKPAASSASCQKSKPHRPKASPTVGLTPAGVAVEARSSPEGDEMWKHHHHQVLASPVAGGGEAGVMSPRSPPLSPGSDGWVSVSGIGPWTWGLDSGDGEHAEGVSGERTANAGPQSTRTHSHSSSFSPIPNSPHATRSPEQDATAPASGLRKMQSQKQLRRVLSQAEVRRGGRTESTQPGGGVQSGTSTEEGRSRRWLQRSSSRPGLRQSDEGEEVPPVPPVPHLLRIANVPSVLERMKWKRGWVS